MNKTALFWSGFGLVIAGVVFGLLAVYGNQTPDTTEKTVTLLEPVGATDHVQGPANASVVLVEYADFQCPTCQVFSPMLERLMEEEGTSLQFAYRYFPLPQHPNAYSASYAAEAAGVQGKFWEMHHLLYAEHAAWEREGDPTKVYEGFAAALGLDMAKFTADMKSEAVIARVKKDRDGASANALTYTPTLFINGVRVQNPPTYEVLKALVDAAKSGGRAVPN